MKHLVVIRHAAALSPSSQIADIDRPLSEVGVKEAVAVGNFLKSRMLFPHKIVCSTAKRTSQTAEKIAGEIEYELHAIEYQDALYWHGLKELLLLVQKLDDTWDRVYIIGHNPSVTLLVNSLTDANVGALTTAGIASIVFEVDSWTESTSETGRLTFLESPSIHPI